MSWFHLPSCSEERRAFGKKCLKRLGLALLVICLIILIALEILSRGAAQIFNYAMANQDMLRGTITVERLISDITGHVYFTGLEWKDREGNPILEIPSGDFRVNVWDVLTRDFKSTTIRELTVNQPSVSVHLSDDMKVDFVRPSPDMDRLKKESEDWREKVNLATLDARERRAVGHHGHGFGEPAVAFGDFLVAQIVRVFDVVLQLALRMDFGGVFAKSCIRAGGRHVGEVVEHAEFARVGSGGQQGHAEFLVLVRGGHEFVATRVDAGRDSQHDACALAETLGDGGDTLRLARLVHDDLVEALFDGEFDFRVGLVVAVQHEPAAGNARGVRDAHLAHGAGVDEHAGFGDDSADFLA